MCPSPTRTLTLCLPPLPISELLTEREEFYYETQRLKKLVRRLQEELHTEKKKKGHKDPHTLEEELGRKADALARGYADVFQALRGSLCVGVGGGGRRRRLNLLRLLSRWRTPQLLLPPLSKGHMHRVLLARTTRARATRKALHLRVQERDPRRRQSFLLPMELWSGLAAVEVEVEVVLQPSPPSGRSHPGRTKTLCPRGSARS